jgi:hypothetical protein
LNGLHPRAPEGAGSSRPPTPFCGSSIRLNTTYGIEEIDTKQQNKTWPTQKAVENSD